jgi:TonB-linked SusC/RagA family outer membrane protein
MFGTEVHEMAMAVNTVNTNSWAENYNNEGYLARGQYSFDNKYFASAMIRRDASSRFHPDHRWGNFWSLGASWLLNRERFLEGVTWIDMLKFKASYGETGNDRIGNFRYVDTFDIVSSNNAVSLIPRAKGNENITWETVGTFNTGIEFDLLKSRLSGSVEYYIRKTSDMLFNLPTPESSGFSSYYSNIGDMTNSGVEIDLRGIAVRARNVNLSLFANITFNKNKILRLPPERVTPEQNGFATGDYFLTEGGTMYDWYMREFAGIDHETGESQWYKTPEDQKLDPHMNPTAGRELTKDWTAATLYRQKTALPKANGGFGATLAFYGFDLSVHFNYQIGGMGYDSDYMQLMRSISRTTDGQTLHKDLHNAWTPTNKTSDIPRFQFNDTYTNGRSTRFLTDLSYLDLSNINLGYTFPSRWTDAINIGSARIYCTAENIHYWSKRKGFDPRQTFTGTAMVYTYPPIRTISGGLQLTF